MPVVLATYDLFRENAYFTGGNDRKLLAMQMATTTPGGFWFSQSLGRLAQQIRFGTLIFDDIFGYNLYTLTLC